MNPHADFQLSMAHAFAEQLRGVVSTLDSASATAAERHAKALSLYDWIHRLQNTQSAWNAAARKGVVGILRAQHLIQCVGAAEYLSQKGSMKVVLKKLFRIVFSPAEAQSLIRQIGDARIASV